MTYRIEGIDPAPFQPLFDASGEVLAEALAARMVAANDHGFPCRVSLEDAREGEELILIHHVSNAVAGPFRMAHAIYVRRGARRAATIRDRLPTMLDSRTLGLRAFDREGMMRAASLASPGQGDAQVRALFGVGEIAYVHAHNAAYGCFLAAIERA